MTASVDIQERPGRTEPEHPPETEPGYVLWTHIGSESVFFYPPGSVEEHLVTEHGVPSVNMHWQVRGHYNHAGDHVRQLEIPLGAVGDLFAVAHTHNERRVTARAPRRRREGA